MDVLILVCALSVSAPECQKDTSISMFYAPDPQTDAASCMRHGLMYAAQSRMVGPGTYPKIYCIPPRPKAKTTV